MGFDYKRGFAVAAHRGDSHNCYENTMEAFEAGRAAGSDMIETDVRMTLDGVLVLMHDEKVLRTTGQPGEIRSMTYEEVSKLNAGDVFQPASVPTLDEFLRWAAPYENLWLNIELKEYFYPGNEERCRECVDKVVALLRKYGLEKRIVLNSFDAYPLEYADETYNHEFMIHGFYPYEAMKNVRRNPDEYLFCACIWGSVKTKAYYDYLLERGIEPWVGASLTSAQQLNMAAKYGAKLVTTNFPADILDKLKGLGLRNE